MRFLLSYPIPPTAFLSQVYYSLISHFVGHVCLRDGFENGCLSARLRPTAHFHSYVSPKFCHLRLKMIMFGSIPFVALCLIRRSLRLCLHCANQVRRTDYMQLIDVKTRSQLLSFKWNGTHVFRGGPFHGRCRKEQRSLGRISRDTGYKM